ncbi:BrnT family toxin [Rubellimicrobium rubrum]|uniref:BrnT family toxin n=1 Tax=Rubellimicrobium rubrum TaxID=2585369 RepID=A0A5C4MJT3_9RHOB|nr:BrnT family toxin [Rubellimicrobium rubrum]TNC44242.1 BrnT family toxin [Rubellimicrobium rubrum]
MFEWDEAKRERTLSERGLDFADARALFDGRPVLHVPARTETEARTLTVGQLGDGKFYTVVWTWRGEVRRIISFRRARDEEERRYWLYLGPDHPSDG